MTRTTIDCCELWPADCRTLLPALQGVTVLITNPPYGMHYRQKRSRDKWVHPDTEHPPIAGNDVSFDPTPLLGFARVILWGAHLYADKLPPSRAWLIWDKRKDTTPDDSADGEQAWTNLSGPLRIFRHLWRGVIREGEENLSRGGKKLHPNQKPVALMQWCLERAKVGPDDVVCDPYMGSASLGVACLRRGVRYIGIEIDPTHYRTAVARLHREAAHLQDKSPPDTSGRLVRPPRSRHGATSGGVDGLSQQQQRILLRLLAGYHACEQAGGDRELHCWGLPWGQHGTRAQQASMSRALRRLEHRGLILRQNRVSGTSAGRSRDSAAEDHQRSTHVLLLPAGREIAEQLTHGTRDMLTV